MFNQWLNWWNQENDLNAVLVKEVRQMVRSRLLLTVMGLELFALGITCFVFLVMAASSAGTGRYFFLGLIFILGTAQGLGAVDLLSRTLKEREPGAVDLLFITSLTPSQIIRGKFWAGLGINLLVVALGLPFLALSYLLRGLDLPTILLGAVYLVSLALLLVAAVLAVALLPIPNLLKKYGFGVAMIVGVVAMNGVVYDCLNNASSMGWLTWQALVIYVGSMGTMLWSLGGLARFLLAAPTSDRSGGFRLVLLLCGLVWVLLTWLAAQKSIDYIVVIGVGMVILHALPVIGVVLALFCSELVQLGWRRNGVSRFPSLAFPFYEGTVNGVVWSAGVAALVVSGIGLLAYSFGKTGFGSCHDYLAGSLLAYGYLFCYALTARAFCDWLHCRWQMFFSPILAFTVMLGGAGLLMVLVTIIHEAFEKYGEMTWPFIGNILVFIWDSQRNACFYIHLAAIAVWLVLLALVLPMLAARRRQQKAGGSR